ncbi:MAG: PH domain-containing protein [Myxococcota bacterium]
MNVEASSNPEAHLWKGYPSQLTAIRFYLVICLVVGILLGLSAYVMTSEAQSLVIYPLTALLVVGLTAVIKFYLVRTSSYELTTERLILERGVLSRESEELELYRIRDWSISKPFWLRLAGRGHVKLVTTDATAPEIVLEAVGQPERVRELLRRYVEAARERKRAREIDLTRDPPDSEQA